jgi:prolipoprotein diacylglyceryltransferase
MLLYGISRYIIEFFRGDVGRGTVFTVFSTTQFISVILVPLSIAMLVYLSRRQQPEPKQARRRAA